MSMLTAADQAGIQALFEAYGTAWGRGDAAACAALYAPDGDAFAIDGEVLSGSAEIERYYAQQLSAKYKDVTMSDFELAPPRALGSDVSLMNASWQLQGLRSSHDASQPVRVRGTFIMRKHGDSWRYVAVRLMVPFEGKPETRIAV